MNLDKVTIFKKGDFMKKVLIVDDAAFMRASLRKMLENIGFDIAGEAVDGADGVRKYAALVPDIVTMDITMPNMDGIRALKEIKRLNEKAVVVMISAMGQESHVKEAVIAGAKGFIVKPFKDETVRKTFDKLK